MECADNAHGLSAHIISVRHLLSDFCHNFEYCWYLAYSIKRYPLHFFQDGGCTCPGDIAKAIGAGADFVMLGGMLAGHDQSGGEIIEKDGKKRKQFYGMSSSTAMKKHKVTK